MTARRARGPLEPPSETPHWLLDAPGDHRWKCFEHCGAPGTAEAVTPRDSLHSDDNGTIYRVPAHLEHLTSIMSSILTSPTRQAAVTDCFTDGARRLEG